MTRSLFGILRSPQAQRLSAVDKLVLLYITWRQGGHDTAWPSLRRIALDLAITKGVVVRSITRLVAAGLLQKVGGLPGRGHVNRYSIATEKGRAGAPFIAKKKVAPEHVKRSRPDTAKGRAARPPSEVTSEVTTLTTHAHRGDEYPADFERFWRDYPKKIGKAKAAEEWGLLSPSPELAERIIAGVEDHIDSEQWSRSLTEDGGRYVPSPAKFLAERRWEDQPPAKPEPQRGDPDWLPTEEEADRLLGFRRDQGGDV